MLTRALGVAVLPLLATQTCDLDLPPPPTREETCLGSRTTWIVVGLSPEQVPEVPDQLLKARLRVGEMSALRATSAGSQCDDLVSGVEWRASVPQVADVVPRGGLQGRLEARSPGETVVWGDVTLRNGGVRRAALYAVPAGRTAQLPVHAVTVTEQAERPCDPHAPHPGC
jgi:hypothetical protein